MDGCRARRLKVGSPLGRLVDEAGDCIVQACYSTYFVYLMNFDNRVLEIFFFYMNIGFFGMEVKFRVTGSLVMQIGEISVVEVELTLALLLAFAGVYGHAGLQDTLA
mmetsp:Transcript_24690/g.30818  ORF Transcript_24690/g.30818 Transcript_24690/m.30818 type:complete len:107 (+) Transcript_24690:84-404(+)